MLATKYPIEVVVFTFILTTLAYFHTLSQIKHSQFFSPLDFRHEHQSHSTPETVQIDLETKHSLHVQQIHIPTYQVEKVNSGLELGVSDVAASIAKSKFYIDICANNTCPTHVAAHSLIVGFPFHSQHREFVSRLTDAKTRLHLEGGISASVVDPSGAHTGSGTGNGEDYVDIASMKSGKWVAFAFRAFITRLWDLTKNADSLDVYTVLAGYLLMHLTFVSLPFRARNRFPLPTLPSPPYMSLTCAILASALLAFIISLPISSLFRIPIDPISLMEALPFFVITVGFDKPLRLARAVFHHPSLLLPHQSTASDVVRDAWKKVGVSIWRDYAIEIGVLMLGVWAAKASKVGMGGVQEFCALAALILIVDAGALWGFYTGVLTIMVEVQRITNPPLRSSTSTPMPSLPPTRSTTPTPQSQSRRGSVGLRNASSNPVPRLKLLLLISFITLHALNLLNTLSPANAHLRWLQAPPVPDSSSSSTSGVGVVVNDLGTHTGEEDVSDEKWKDDDLEEFLNILTTDFGAKTAASIQIHPPLQVNFAQIDSSATSPFSRQHTSPASATNEKDNTSQSLPFSLPKISLSRLLGDPLLSKWMVVALALSFSLNGVLLKGLGDRRSMISNEGLAELVESEAEKLKERELEERDQEQKVIVRTHASEVARRELPREIVVSSGSSDVGSVPEKRVPPPLLMPKPKAATGYTILGAPTNNNTSSASITPIIKDVPPAQVAELKATFAAVGAEGMSNEQMVQCVEAGIVQAYNLEKTFGSDHLERAVEVRRLVVGRAQEKHRLSTGDDYVSSPCLDTTLTGVPFEAYDYSKVLGACCENVIGYIPIPLGVAGPLMLDGSYTYIPMATAEGTLVASTSRGCKALNSAGGVTTVITQDVMTRGPALSFPSIQSAAKARSWIESEIGYKTIKSAFESTSRFAKLERCKCANAGRTLYVRFATRTGDAMGMNMISKGVEKALSVMSTTFPEMEVLALSGNYCTDKKPAAINWIEGRGKSVIAEAVIKGDVVKSVLKTTVQALVNLNEKKNLVGSAMAGSIGGFNAHAANILTAIFLATGQDPAQNVESSNCMTLMEAINDGKDLLVTVTMPSIEVGTVGGGTVLTPQQSALKFLGMQGAHPTTPGMNAQALARLIAGAVMAGELSLMGALAAGHLIRAHMSMNRTPASSRPTTPGPAMTLTPANAPNGAQVTSKSVGSTPSNNRGFLSPLSNSTTSTH